MITVIYWQEEEKEAVFTGRAQYSWEHLNKLIKNLLSFTWFVVFLTYVATVTVQWWAGLCASKSELCNFFSDSYNITLSREAALSQSDINTLHGIALNSFLLWLFATKIETNKSWLMGEYTHLFESWEETISKQNLSSFFAVFFFGIFFRHTCSRYPGKYTPHFTHNP